LGGGIASPDEPHQDNCKENPAISTTAAATATIKAAIQHNTTPGSG